VETDPTERERLDSLVEHAGLTAVLRPGATEPDYTRVGARDGLCPLVEAVDVVVLDMSLDSEGRPSLMPWQVAPSAPDYRGPQTAVTLTLSLPKRRPPFTRHFVGWK
jgi:hypothetical protein